MTILRILQYPDKRLNAKAEWVQVFDERVKKDMDDLLETLNNTENCAGLAATQVDFEHPLRMTAINQYTDAGEQVGDPLILVNPEIIERSEELRFEPEGCMSVGGSTYEALPRARRVKFRALNYDAQEIEMEVEGYMAKLIQHEIEHLEGIIFIDHLSRLKRQRVDTKIAKWHRIEMKSKTKK